MTNTSAQTSIIRLTRRWQFLAAAQGATCARGAVMVQRLKRSGETGPAVGAGFTATKKIGNAVVRNRCKRRLREAARALLPLHGDAGHDYVFVARSGLVERGWDALLDDMKSALISLREGRSDAKRPPRLSKRPSPPPTSP